MDMVMRVIYDPDTDTPILNTVPLPQVSTEFATAYFNIAGFSLIKDSLIYVEEFKLLLGREPTSEDFKGNLVELLSDFTAKYSPFDIYVLASSCLGYPPYLSSYTRDISYENWRLCVPLWE